MIYDRLGPPFLRFVAGFLRRRYRRQLRIGAGVVVGLVGLAAYVATRNVPEG